MRRSILCLLGVALLALPACGGAEAEAGAELERSTTTSTTTTTTPPTTTAPPTFPLTGLPLTDPAFLSRPALAVKFDNVERARPQMGINQADVVYEELVEGGITRLLAVFHSGDANPLGPIRSARTTDLSILAPLNRPLFAWSGAADWVVPRVRGANLVDVGHGAAPHAYRRRGDRRAPHNLYSTTQELFALAPAGSVAPPPLFTFRGTNAPLGANARPVGGVDLSFGAGPGAVPVQYRWDPNAALWGGWVRFQAGTVHTDEAGIAVTPNNVIVQFVPYGLDSPQVPLAYVEGSGPAWVFTNGHVIEATWSKPAPNAVTQYTDAAGQPIGLTPGRTWVALVASGGAAQGNAVVV